MYTCVVYIVKSIDQEKYYGGVCRFTSITYLYMRFKIYTRRIFIIGIQVHISYTIYTGRIR